MVRSIRIVSSVALIALLSTSSAFAQVVEQFRIGALRLAYVAQHSKTARAAIAQVEAFERKKVTEVESKAAELQKQQIELKAQSATMSPRAVADLQRAFDKARLDFDRFQQDARAEVEAMQTKFDADFRVRLSPIIDEISKEKGLHFVFGIEQASMVAWWSPAVDISEEVVKRLDAALRH
jgi:Skp family chaperone for outer membrane proteins